LLWLNERRKKKGGRRASRRPCLKGGGKGVVRCFSWENRTRKKRKTMNLLPREGEKKERGKRKKGPNPLTPIEEKKKGRKRALSSNTGGKGKRKGGGERMST